MNKFMMLTVTKSLEADMATYPARLTFRHAGTIDVGFMVDADHH